MANTSQILGLIPIERLYGGEDRSNEYYVKSGSCIYRGDLLIVDTTGAVTPATSNTTATINNIGYIGVALEYVCDNTSGKQKVMVADSPGQVFVINAKSGTACTVLDLASTSVFNNLGIAGFTNGNTTYKNSGMYADADTAATTSQLPLRLLGLLDVVDAGSGASNTWGANCKVKVIINNHFYKQLCGL
jgi:hypothetical protein